MKKGCIIVPYRDRAEHLGLFLKHYGGCGLDIFIIEQSHGNPFNRAKLLNIGYLEAGHEYDYAVYHDVDMIAQECIPNAYRYPKQPTHLAGKCSQFNYKMPYPTYFGGVLMMNSSHMKAVNGYSNNFWGWGGEDDDMYRRVVGMGLTPVFEPVEYKSLPHGRVIDKQLHKENVYLLKKPIDYGDGLTSCKYQVANRLGLDGAKEHIIVRI